MESTRTRPGLDQDSTLGAPDGGPQSDHARDTHSQHHDDCDITLPNLRFGDARSVACVYNADDVTLNCKRPT